MINDCSSTDNPLLQEADCPNVGFSNTAEATWACIDPALMTLAARMLFRNARILTFPNVDQCA